MNPALIEECQKAAALGVIEGLTEFIPVSSTGHLILMGHWMAFSPHLAQTFEIFIQLGAVVALVGFYRSDLRRWSRDLRTGGAGLRVGCCLVLGFIPVAVVGLLCHEAIEARLMAPVPVALALIVGALALGAVERLRPETRVRIVEEITPTAALAVGLFQCLSLWPGFSRSAATILGGLVLGFSLPVAVEFSFLLSIPTLGAATGYSLFKAMGSLSTQDLLLLALGFTAALLTSLPVLAGFLRYIRTRSLRPFVYYRIVLGLLVLTR